MSLVAYAASSDEDSDCETTTEACPSASVKQTTKDSIAIEKQQNGPQQQQQQPESSKSLNLPQPKNIQIENNATAEEEEEEENFSLNLPAPKQSQALDVEEADDEFLHKKVDPSLIEKPTQPKKTQKQKAGTRQPVKITIPSLAELRTNDDDAATSSNGKSFSVGPNPKKSSGLLSMLPPPKFNGIFGKPKEKPDSTSTAASAAPITKTTSLIPHSVSKRQAAAIKPKPPNAEKKSSLGLSYNNNSDDSDADDDASGDFFSLNAETKLPEVSAAEINAMVAKKTNRMAEFSRNLDVEQQRAAAEAYEYAQTAGASNATVPDHDQINIEALIGARAAKRSRKDDIQFIDIRQDQVASTNDEWMRNRLQSETEFQPTGRLVGSDQPGAGTKKKHQITYLAYQAKANEAELQAMWANNRQSRRQTQSKYGF